ncbi:hypothetical protein Peur_018350 [Populus x canadensis]
MRNEGNHIQLLIPLFNYQDSKVKQWWVLLLRSSHIPCANLKLHFHATSNINDIFFTNKFARRIHEEHPGICSESMIEIPSFPVSAISHLRHHNSPVETETNSQRPYYTRPSAASLRPHKAISHLARPQQPNISSIFRPGTSNLLVAPSQSEKVSALGSNQKESCEWARGMTPVVRRVGDGIRK